MGVYIPANVGVNPNSKLVAELSSEGYGARAGLGGDKNAGVSYEDSSVDVVDRDKCSNKAAWKVEGGCVGAGGDGDELWQSSADQYSLSDVSSPSLRRFISSHRGDSSDRNKSGSSIDIGTENSEPNDFLNSGCP